MIYTQAVDSIVTLLEKNEYPVSYVELIQQLKSANNSVIEALQDLLYMDVVVDLSTEALDDLMALTENRPMVYYQLSENYKDNLRAFEVVNA